MIKMGARLSLIVLVMTGLAACQNEAAPETQTGIIIEQEYGDGPFGAYMGMPKSEFARLEETDFNLYKTYNMPRSNTAFEFYEVSFAEDGLCMIQALGIDVETDAAGGDLKFEFDRFAEGLDKKYGESDDFREEDGSDPEKGKPISYMQRLLDGDQIRERYWWAPEGGTLPAKINSISLRTKALSEELGYLVIRYEFENYPKCEAMDKAAETENL